METLFMDLEVNPRVASMQPSATFSMTARAKARIREGYPVIGLSAGEPDFDTPTPIAEAAILAIREGFTHYTENRGMLALREAICEKLSRVNGIEYSPDEILCTNGAKQSIAQVLSVICGPGDEILIPAPYWVSYPEQVRFAGGQPIPIPTTVESDYRITAPELETRITEKTRALILCSPSNPTGSVYSPDELRALADVLERCPKVYVISDEIYEQIIYDAEHLSFGSIPGMKQRTITINGFSKSYAMTGWRLGYMAAESQIVGEVAKLQSQFTSAPCSISQKAGIAALEMDRGPIMEMVSAFRERRDFVLGALEARQEVRCPKPEGAFYVFPDISAFYGRTTPSGNVIENSEQMCFYVLDEFNVALVPGHAFGGPYGVRISYAASMTDLEEAMRRIDAAFNSLT